RHGGARARVFEARDGRFGKAGPERRRADHHPVGAGVQRRRDRLEAPVAASDLERRTAGFRQALDELEARHAGERAVEVDEMEAVGALRCEATGELDRIAALERYRLPPASRESDGS